MTKKDFIAIAARFKQGVDGNPDSDDYGRGWNDARKYLAKNLADVCAADNPRFNRAKFLQACGVAD